MTAILVVRPSSLGDIVHALSLVADVRAHRSGIAVDWVADESFAPPVALDPGVRRVVAVDAVLDAAGALLRRAPSC